jgi:hypothetical protein
MIKHQELSTRMIRLVVVALLSVLLGACPQATTPFAPPGQVCFQAFVAYYYRYKQATPNESDIAFVEAVPAQTRCVVPSANAAPVFPDAAVTQVIGIAAKADIAVYYGKDAEPPNPGPHPVLAVEDLKGVSRSIQTFTVRDTTNPPPPACPPCPSSHCGQYACCKPC